MKLSFFAIIIILMTTELSYGQNLTIGPRIGANFSNIKGLSQNTVRAGWTGGGFISFRPLKKIGVSADLLLSSKGAHIKNFVGNETSSETWNSYINLIYFEIPVLVSVYLSSENSSFRPRVFVGPSIATQLSATETMNYSKHEIDKDSSSSWSQTTSSKFKKLDIGVVAGFGFDYKMTENTFFSIDVRYLQGLTDLRKPSGYFPNSLYNRNLSIFFGIGYKIGN